MPERVDRKERMRSIRESYLVTMRMGNNYLNHKGGCGPLVSKELSLTLATNNSQILFVFKKKKHQNKEVKK